MKSIPGINIQYPWSMKIINGSKTIETRGYKLPRKFEKCCMALIETPGDRQVVLKARIIGLITFDFSFQYLNEDEWRNDVHRHLIETGDESYGFKNSKAKWGWKVSCVTQAKCFIDAPLRKGIIYSSDCKVPESILDEHLSKQI